MTDAVQRLQWVLGRMGTTPWQVASTLISAGIRGEQCRSAVCPLAVYLTARMGREVLVSAGIATMLEGGDYRDVLLPGAVSDFVRRFDNGAYELLRIPGSNGWGGYDDADAGMVPAT